MEVLARSNDRIVLTRQGRLLEAAFYPELIGETRLHRYFVDIAASAP